jgi:glycerol-3-phosphate dehydrogenase
MLRPLVDGVEGPAFAPQVFHEAMHDDARTNVAIALTAAKKGAAVANYCEVTSLLKDAGGRAQGVAVLDRVSNERFDVRAKAVVFCGEPWCEIQDFTARSRHRRSACSMAWRCRFCTRHTG